MSCTAIIGVFKNAEERLRSTDIGTLFFHVDSVGLLEIFDLG